MEGYTALISGLFALSGALGGQVLNNILTNNREGKKYEKEVYQELYSPVLLDIIALYDIRTNFRRSHDIKDHIIEENLVNEIKEKINNNIKHANSAVISAYQELKRFDYYEDLSGFAEERLKLLLYKTLLSEAYNHLKKEKLLNQSQLSLINEYRIKYFLWYMMVDYIKDSVTPVEIMSRFWCISEDVYTDSFYEHLQVRFEKVERGFFKDVFESEFKGYILDDCEDMFADMLEKIDNQIP
ncbi:hypothetical protein [Bacillus sp. AG4(2022)]|uniref:hypothetical protein n=1 Tax=Bacillus sp. AG4(2022) TaxID=2962594 RepID=UPI002881D7F9|nr:hypothetical protein [Bacillus sp. AG4(2022)]MDT0161871.1 hypothetical protein [Bacillus sp. AG4(2022)]